MSVTLRKAEIKMAYSCSRSFFHLHYRRFQFTEEIMNRVRCYRVNSYNVGWEFETDVGNPTHVATIMKVGTPKYVAVMNAIDLSRLSEMTRAIVWTIFAATPVIQIAVDRRTIAVITGKLIQDELIHAISSIISKLGVPYGFTFSLSQEFLQYAQWIVEVKPEE